MKILVTGATGFLGAAVVKRLLCRGERDLRLFLRPTSRPSRLQALAAQFPDASVELCFGTLDDVADACRAVEGVDIVYHLVAAGSGDAADIFQGTVATSQNLLDALLLLQPPQRPKVVLISSFSVYAAALLPRKAVIDELTAVEPNPKLRDLYAQAKLWQERLFWEFREDHGLSLVVLRPGVIYGPGGPRISPRVGICVNGTFLLLGGRNALPLTYVENCAEAIVLAGGSPESDGEIYNIVDDEIPTCRRFLQQYRQQVQPLRTVSLPYAATMALAQGIRIFNMISPIKVPPLLTPYRTAASWKGNRFDNTKMKSLGFVPLIATSAGLRATFDSLSGKAA